MVSSKYRILNVERREPEFRGYVYYGLFLLDGEPIIPFVAWGFPDMAVLANSGNARFLVRLFSEDSVRISPVRAQSDLSGLMLWEEGHHG